MKKLAIIGSGISGISVAYHLRNDYDITVIEKNDYIGGHTNTHVVKEGDREIGIDTAFMVWNPRSYKNLYEFFKELELPYHEIRGGFNFWDRESGVQYGTQDFDLTPEEISGQYPESFVKIYEEANRFHKECVEDFKKGRTWCSLNEYLDRNNYSEAFKYGFVVLIGCAAWTVTPETLLEYPASTVIAFYMIHGPGGLTGKTMEWCSLEGGSHHYLKKVQALLKRPA